MNSLPISLFTYQFEQIIRFCGKIYKLQQFVKILTHVSVKKHGNDMHSFVPVGVASFAQNTYFLF